ncbi:MAG: class II fumarate hydratase [Caldibacillus debilis]|jgi:fumarate hydratase class II|uniref:Fumarate hydratase class II n=1 Tax=Caldibacillus debilis TaxID=301148 RepID=A0A150M4A2_9BACI|nr:class II fumarate hydratase [Caldibacillus debilis]MBO2480965.1 class II fumarate hydratase [Bacillaceae bacterium]KYD19196.1 Fumarate hydratase class II [Caldibacillus debilis]OUM86218.1 MAG: fumarate hydratase, class II [Caldibacillus debilis]REJ16313.1 MAG: class II fumarate hydratase [Caldibacillus debilis]REJ28116.1 MAG: class II fumarate hydratase [Caldibacillus debilis]
MEMRVERDTLGEVLVPADKYWGAQTERSRQNFRIGEEKMPLAVIYAFAQLKKAAAIVNHKLGKLSEAKKNAIVQACDEIIAKKWDEHFPLVVWQTGSGTQSNMNVNEVISRRGNELLGNSGEKIHPNDDVNMSQSSNDTFPTAMHIAGYTEIVEKLFPAIEQMIATLKEKEEEYKDLIKIGRTHLQDATPLTLGQEISGWRNMLEKDLAMLKQTADYLLDLAIGGTAVGTGINAPKNFGEEVARQLREQTGYPFRSSPNKFQSLTSHDEIVAVHGVLKALAADLMKIANDVRWLASGPRSGLGEITIPANEPGSSIMPGKVNPTQSEAVTMVATQVFGNDAAIGFAASQGNFELNVFKPVIIYNFLQSVRLLADSIRSFHDRCLVGLKANEGRIKELMERSLMLVTALNPHIGYEKAAEIAKLAHREGISLKEAALKTGYVTEEQYDEWVDPRKMV